MSNIVDYVKWRGDLSFKVSPMNEIDNLIMARISYLPFEKVKWKEKISFKEIVKQFLKLKVEQFHMPEDVELIKAMIESNRFCDLEFSDMQYELDAEEEKQFFAITVWLPNGELFVSFRGTDATLVGWKEDFNMSFMNDLPSQKEGVSYVEMIAMKYPFKKLRIGGHSKGGNVAVYSSIFCNPKVKKRIVEVTSADGPGFDRSIIETKEYKEILDRIHTYIPQSSIIGRLLEHEEEYHIVESIQKGIMQHDIYSWQVEGPKIHSIAEVTSDSQMVNGVVRSWLKNTTPEQRKLFINIVFEVLNTTNATTTHELSVGLVKNMGKVMDAYKDINEDERKEMKEIFKVLIKSSFETLKNELTDDKNKKKITWKKA